MLCLLKSSRDHIGVSPDNVLGEYRYQYYIINKLATHIRAGDCIGLIIRLINSNSIYAYISCCRKFVERLCKLMKRYGPDYWWELPIEKLIGRDLRQELNIDEWEKGNVCIIVDPY